MPRYKKGDIYECIINDETKRYFQYIDDDVYQLNSNIIRVFKTSYKIIDNPDFQDIVNDEIDFYAHVFLKLGIKLEKWNKIGHYEYTDKCNVLFRDSSDYGDPEIKISRKWWIWKANEEHKFVGELKGEYQKAEIGIVFNPNAIIKRMIKGKYEFVYPGF